MRLCHREKEKPPEFCPVFKSHKSSSRERRISGGQFLAASIRATCRGYCFIQVGRYVARRQSENISLARSYVLHAIHSGRVVIFAVAIDRACYPGPNVSAVIIRLPDLPLSATPLPMLPHSQPPEQYTSTQQLNGLQASPDSKTNTTGNQMSSFTRHHYREAAHHETHFPGIAIARSEGGTTANPITANDSVPNKLILTDREHFLRLIFTSVPSPHHAFLTGIVYIVVY